ncbi:MAG: NADH-quinone oxidoreductase subunit J [Anaerolineae bacterium]|jgi:NADH-quinone oxidoreductase subunit J|nr:NADH-quinone oxidoreductase subunit J [Anaerolineae bacterium]
MVLFVVFALIAIVAAVGVIISRRPIYSALFLLLNFASLAALYIMLQAQFLAAVQVIVYGGAIVVLFLFVVMLLGGGELNDIRDTNRPFLQRFGWQRFVAVGLGVLMVAGLGYGLVTGELSAVQGDPAAFGQGSVQAIGSVLYTDYLLPFELASVLLLVGMIGAVVLARPPE